MNRRNFLKVAIVGFTGIPFIKQIIEAAAAEEAKAVAIETDPLLMGEFGQYDSFTLHSYHKELIEMMEHVEKGGRFVIYQGRRHGRSYIHKLWKENYRNTFNKAHRVPVRRRTYLVEGRGASRTGRV